MKKNNNALFYTCSLIEFIARKTKNSRGFVVDCLGDDISRIYSHQDVFHCEPIEKVADDFIRRDSIAEGSFDAVKKCRYTVPDYWDIGEVFARLVEDSYSEQNVIKGIEEVFHSWLADKIVNFNSDLYYQSREYLAECYKQGKLLIA